MIVPVREGWVKEEQIKVFGKLLAKKEKINENNSTSLYKSVGMGLFDLIVAEAIYNEAVKKGIGQKLEE